VVKAEVDFIHNSFRAAGKKPEIIVHEFCGESGAIGAAIESLRLWRNGLQTSFIGLDAVRQIQYRTTRNEATRCNFCKNNCLRTFIDIRTAELPASDPLSLIPIKKVTKVPLMHGEDRLIIATCEKGAVEDLNQMKDIKAGLDQLRDAHPNFVDMASKEVFRPTNAKSVADPIPTRVWTKAAKERVALMQNRNKLRIGIPRVLNIYTYAPLFNAYFKSLGVEPENIIFSDYTSSDLYRAGASRGSIDPCFPAKIGISHVYNLIQDKHRKRPLNVIFFPMYDVLTSPLVKIVAANACPTVTATPETVKAAFTKENDVFAEHNVEYVDPVLNFADRKLFAYQMLQAWQPILGLSQEENDRAVESGYKALTEYETSIRRRAREVLDRLEREDRIGIVMLGRPYHHDPGPESRDPG
jgi:predicted nucleotide-binding protein (sugar kinase/HSP70/actin superfamily)